MNLMNVVNAKICLARASLMNHRVPTTILLQEQTICYDQTYQCIVTTALRVDGSYDRNEAGLYIMSSEAEIMLPILCALSVHTDDYIEGTVVYDPDTVHLIQGGLYILAPRSSGTSIQDFQKATSANLSAKENDTGRSSIRKRHGGSKRVSQIAAAESHADLSKSMVFVAQPLNVEQKRKLRGMQVMEARTLEAA